MPGYYLFSLHIFEIMKQKVTLSLKPEVVAKLEAERKRHKTSMSEEVERRVEAQEAPSDEKTPFSKWVGAFADWFTVEDFAADDRTGDELRKTSAYNKPKRKRSA